MKNYIEFCNEQAEKMFQIIDQHNGLLKWQKTWDVKGNISLPKSVNGFYRGSNLWKLLVEQITKRCGSDRWLTFNQVKQQGGHVLKGAKGVPICFFKLKEVEMDDVDDKQKQAPVFRGYTVFNLEQTSLAVQGVHVVQQPMPEKLHQLLSVLKVNVSEFGNQPRYQMVDDVIVMPKREYFSSEQNFNVTLLHELVHWAGHPSRLNRVCAKQYDKNNVARAEEELVAEIGSVFFASYFGISGDLYNHASYVASWKKYLDAKAVGRAMSQAFKAFEWLIGHVEGNEAAA